MKFSEEATLPPSFTPDEQRRFEQVYDPSDAQSLWSVSCALLGLPASVGPLVCWYKNVPYVNWTAVVATVSCGWIEVVDKNGGWAYAERKSILGIPRLVRSQWKIERYVDGRINGAALPVELAARLLESTALGLALQAIMQRLPSNSPQEFATWLSAPDKAPLTVRKTIMQIHGIQRRRTQLSNAWLQLFPPRPARDVEPETPEMFWDRPPLFDSPPLSAPSASAPPATVEWQGLSVCAGQVTGRAVIVKSLRDFTPPDMSDLPVLVFARAKPDTVEIFPHAAALLFAEGGALSHACTIAREQGIPCVTGLGPEFFQRVEELSAHGKTWLSMDGAAGNVKVLQTKN